MQSADKDGFASSRKHKHKGRSWGRNKKTMVDVGLSRRSGPTKERTDSPLASDGDDQRVWLRLQHRVHVPCNPMFSVRDKLPCQHLMTDLLMSCQYRSDHLKHAHECTWTLLDSLPVWIRIQNDVRSRFSCCSVSLNVHRIAHERTYESTTSLRTNAKTMKKKTMKKNTERIVKTGPGRQAKKRSQTEVKRREQRKGLKHWGGKTFV